MSTATSTDSPVYWDPYRPDLGQNPYPTFKRLRQEAPLYYNKDYDFYALSRVSDVNEHFSNTEIFSSARSDIMEFIREDIDIPNGMFIWHDPPLHTVYRTIVSRVFTPKRMNALEQQIRDYCARCLDPLLGQDRINFIDDLGAKLPGGVIGMLLGIPDEARDAVRERVESALRVEEGKPMEASQASYQGEGFEEYVEWRAKNPSDDLMTELLNTEFTDIEGTKRKLTREEVLIFVNVLAGAGNETTAKLIGWTAQLLSDHPDQRREIAADPAGLSELMVACQREAFGDGLASYDPYFWASKLHFYISAFSFYNWPYTFGYLFSSAVYARAQEEGPAFAPRVRTLLGDMGHKWTEELVEDVLGEDITDVAFWQRATAPLLTMVHEFLDDTDEG